MPPNDFYKHHLPLDKIAILCKCIVVAQVLHFLPHGLSQDPLLRVASPCAIAGHYLDCWSLRSVHCWFRITTTTTQRLLSHHYCLPGCQVLIGDDWGTFWTTTTAQASTSSLYWRWSRAVGVQLRNRILTLAFTIIIAVAINSSGGGRWIWTATHMSGSSKSSSRVYKFNTYPLFDC